jgi:CheY-like chemotaxis protein
MLNEELFKFYINNHIKSTRKKKDLKVIAISNLFRANKVKIDDGVVDRVINKPFSQERIFEVIIKIYEQGGREASEKITLSKPKGGHLAYRGIFEEKKNISADNFMDFKNANLLIVEDNTINQKILMSVLAKSHINIIVASNGQEAVDLVTKSSNKFDCILMDINMPIMDGYMATSTIRSDERFVDLPIVALTALVLDSEVDKMFKHGVSGYLSKPLEIGRLYSAFEFFLDKNTKGTELPAANEQIKTKEIDAIDIRQGIAYANGNEALYKEVLSEFISAYGTTDTLLRDLVDDQKYDHIKMLCSDMRSLTKSIGAYRMHEVVDRMYKLFLYNNDHMIPKYAEEYGRELEKLKSSIKIYKERHF